MYVCCWSVQVLGGSIFCPGLFFQERKLKRLGSWLAIEQPCKTEKEFCTATVHGTSTYMQRPCLLAKQICIIDVTSFMLLIEWFTVDASTDVFHWCRRRKSNYFNIYLIVTVEFEIHKTGKAAFASIFSNPFSNWKCLL